LLTAALAVNNRMEDSVKLTDTQLVLLSAASQRDDRALERPSNLTGAAAGKVIAKFPDRRPRRGDPIAWLAPRLAAR